MVISIIQQFGTNELLGLIGLAVLIFLAIVLMIYYLIKKNRKKHEKMLIEEKEERLGVDSAEQGDIIKNVLKEDNIFNYKEFVVLGFTKSLIRSKMPENLIKKKLVSVGCSPPYIDYIFRKIDTGKVKKQNNELYNILTLDFEYALLELIEEMEEISMDNAADYLGISIPKLNEIALGIEDRGMLFVESRGDTQVMLSKELGERRILNKLKDVTPHEPDYYKKTLTKLDDLGELIKQKHKLGYVEAFNILGIKKETFNRHVRFLRDNDFIRLDKEDNKLMMIFKR
ncbi:MAG: hypothetical protein ABIG89_03130 [Candidatus Woesearchaeota archaeon]